MNPFERWMVASNLRTIAAEQAERPFDAVVKAFTYFNCTGNETGTYAAFYLVGEVAP